jgi:uncharacterized membrane protein
MNTVFLATLAAALGSGLVAGIFYGFSTFIMAALRRIPAEQGIAAMQSINITVINPAFFAVFFGTAILCLGLAGAALAGWIEAASGLILAAAALYLIGCIGVTIFGNVPLNDALAAVQPAAPEAAALWARYLDVWTLWNHIRTTASLLAAVLFILALL